MALFGGGPPTVGGVDLSQLLAVLGAGLQDTGAAQYGRPGYALQMLQAEQRRLGDKKQYQDMVKSAIGAESPNTVMSTPSVFEPGRLPQVQAAKANDAQSMMFSGPVGQALGYEQAAAALPMLQNMDPQMGLPALMNMMGQAQERKDRKGERLETRGWQLEDATRNRQYAAEDQGRDEQNARRRLLTPEELKAANYRPGSVVYRDGLGRDYLTQEPDTMSREALNQRLTIAAAGREPAGGPVVIQPGAQLVDRKTGKPLYTAPKKPLPATLQKEESADIDAIQTARSIQQDLGAVKQQITGGQLTLSPFANYAGMAMNAAGMSNQNSRNFASMKATLEKLRNDSLRLNKGVQTEGDSARAWNELFANLNDQKLVEQRLDEIDAINSRGADLRAQQIDLRRQNYGLDPFDAGQIAPPAAVGVRSSDRPQETKSIGGKTYVKINGQWFEQ